MGIRMRDAAGTLRSIVRVRMRDAAGTLRTIQRIRMRDAAGTLRTVFQFLGVTLSHALINGFAGGASASGTVTTGTVSSTVTGGSGSYTYAWSLVSGDPDIVADSPTGANTTFSVTTAWDGFTYQALFRVVVTDTGTGATTEAQVNVTCTWTNTT